MSIGPDSSTVPLDFPQRVIRWLESRQRAGGFICTLCGQRKWGVSDPVEMPQYRSQENLVLLAIPLVCQHCGHVEFLSAQTAGLLPS